MVQSQRRGKSEDPVDAAPKGWTGCWLTAARAAVPEAAEQAEQAAKAVADQAARRTGS